MEPINTPETLTGAQAMVRCLEAEGVSTIFGLPGAAICPFYDALSHSAIRHILVRQEQNAGHAASGYARMTGRPGVCAATSGPGALNLITAIATAYMDSIPLVILTGQVETGLLGRDVFQEADITGSCEPFVKHSYLVRGACELPRVIKEAFQIAGTGRQGPVLIDVPVDVQLASLPFVYPERAELRGYRPSSSGHPGQVKRLAAALCAAKRPLICVGGGVFGANARPELLTLAGQAGLPMVTTLMGLSAVPVSHPLYLGMIGMYGATGANRAMHAADLLLLVGSRLGDRAVASPMGLSQTALVAHIDIDPAEIGKNITTRLPLVGDAKLILAQLRERLGDARCPDWFAEFRAASAPLPSPSPASPEGTVSPRAVIAELCRQAPPDAVLCADVGQNQIWAARGFAVERGRFLTSGGMGTMGYALPCGAGAKLACPGRPVISVCGDGAFQMQMMELATLRANDIPLKILVMNNGRLGLVRELQARRYGGNETAVALDGSPDFIRLAGAYGIGANRLADDADIPAAIRGLLAAEGPFLLECVVAPNEPTLG